MSHGIALLGLLPCPLLIVAFAAGIRRIPVLTRAAALLTWVQCAVSLLVCIPRLQGSTTPVLYYGFAIDRPAAVLLLLTTLVAAASFTHAVVFFGRELANPHPPARQHVSQFYIYAPLFLIAMYGVIAAQNLGFLWIAMEATTLLSAPLVYYHRTKTALEATWKYLIICSVGIAFAFFGTAIIYAASQQVNSLHAGSLLLPDLQAHASLLPRGLLRLGFIFILLGYGTKAGLFPLHSWLPDAHSEAPAPASALLSGALLNCALLALWRTVSLMAAAGEVRLVDQTLLPMALATVAASSLFLLKQHDLKRLLAYSSMENVGIMAVAIALRSSAGFLLQAVNHSLVKVALFLLAGNLLQLYGAK
ncbi:MAG TPA: proton-conducting transporter membrane subunit, partial [Armatimonadota bacterium]|nr:proton-conducting transporter membrane subunit [Armatimonadota bacterium]